MSPGRWAALAALVAVVLHLPTITVPPRGDELNSLYWAALSIKHPVHVFDPWMGGVLRLPPKLAIMAGLELWGVRIWPYHLLNIVIHAFSTILVVRLGTRWSGSARVGGWAAVLFAAGLGVYAKAVVVISNVTMLMGLAFLLIALDLLWSGRWKVALLFFALGIASHEVIVVAPLLIFLIPPSRGGENGVPWGSQVRRFVRSKTLRRAVSGLLLLLVPLLFCPGGLGRFCSYEVQMISFTLFPFTDRGTAIVGDHAGDLVAQFASLVIAWRLWIGIAIVVLVAYLVWRGRALYSFAAAWVLLFFIPFWVIVRCWGGTWLDVRYVYVSAVGVCLLASSLVLRLAGRRRAVASALFSLLILWSVIVGGFWFRGHVRLSERPEEVAIRNECLTQIADMDPRWELP
jgi:hypothetical protein